MRRARFIFGIVAAAFLLHCIPASHGLYEDQIGLFDWHRQFIGQPKFAVTIPQSSHFVVGTGSGVVAGLDIRSGDVRWRAILEKRRAHDDSGPIDFMALGNGRDVIVVSSSGQRIRLFNSDTGQIHDEISISNHGLQLGGGTSDSPSARVSTTTVVELSKDGKGLFVFTSVHENGHWFLARVSLGTKSVKWLISSANGSTRRFDSAFFISAADDASKVTIVGREVSAEAARSVTVGTFDYDDGTPDPVWDVAGMPAEQPVKCIAGPPAHTILCLAAGTSAVYVIDTASRSALPAGSNTMFADVKCEMTENAPVDSDANTRLWCVGENCSSFLLACPAALHHYFLDGSAYRSNTLSTESNQFDVSVGGKIPAVVTAGVDADSGNVILRTHKVHGGSDSGDTGTTIVAVATDGQPTALFAWQQLGGVKEHFFIVMASGRVLFITNNVLQWSRDEGLAQLLSTTAVELPESALQVLLEDEFDSPVGPRTTESSLLVSPTAIFRVFFRRIRLQLLQLRQITVDSTAFLTEALVNGLGGQAIFSSSGTARSSKGKLLLRNSFNTQKLIMGASFNAKLFGINSATGSTVWGTFLGDGITCWRREETDSASCTYPLFIMRANAPHPFADQPMAAVVAHDRQCQCDVVITVNPITGDILERRAFSAGKILLASLLPLESSRHIRPLILHVAERGGSATTEVVLFPTEDAGEAHVAEFVQRRLFLTWQESAFGVAGCRPARGQVPISARYQCMRMWSVLAADAESGERITSLATRHPLERVHTDARIVGEESILYKFVNPNLMAVVVEGVEVSESPAASAETGDDADRPASKAQTHGGNYFTILLLDMASGRIVTHISHRRCRGPVKVVVSENWLMYIYWNERSRSTELSVIDMYVGQQKLSGSTSARKSAGFAASDQLTGELDSESGHGGMAPLADPPASGEWLSSLLMPHVKPEIFRQSYNIRGLVDAIGMSLTQRGMTHKALYFGLASGAVLELPKAIIDARRPPFPTAQSREEGLAPYTPELPIVLENVINYNHTVGHVRAIDCFPAGLESTVLVLVRGIDLFFTQSAPSKRFDVLKDDFDYALLSLSMFIFLSICYACRHYARDKVLKRVWK